MIRGFRGFRSFRTFRARLFILLIISMISLLSIVSYLYYRQATTQYHDKVTEIAEKNVKQTMQVYDLLLDSYNSLSKSLVGNADMLRILPQTHTDNPALNIINERAVSNIIGTVFYSREDIVSIHVFAQNGAVFSFANYLNVVDPNYAQRDWYNRIKQSDGNMVWLGAFKHSLTDQTVAKPVFAFGRLLFDLTAHKPIGVLLFQMDASAAMSALGNMRLGPDSDVFIMSEDGRLLASDDPEEISSVPWSEHAGDDFNTDVFHTPNSAESAESMASDTLDVNGTKPAHLQALELLLSLHENVTPSEVLFDQRANDLIVASKAKEVDWTFISRTPNSNLNVEFNQTRHFFLIVVSVLVLVSIAIASFIARTITMPLKRLVQEMRQVEIGNFRGVAHRKSTYEEIDILVSSFNQMVYRMDDLIQREKESSGREKQAQLQALQSQVNPHFLYNTLNMIYWLLDEQENDKLARIVLSLSHMFQYSSEWEENSNSTLGEELEAIRHYLTIIEARLEDRLTADIAVAPEWLDVQLPKMTLQPIIENAVKHGLEPSYKPGILTVRAEAEGQRLHITIADNGVGMDPEALSQLQQALGQHSAQEQSIDAAQRGSTGRKGIGIANVHHRLVLMHGESYGLSADSKKGVGTTIIVTLPLPPRVVYDRSPEYNEK
ncbi:sensor histidine kinase [Paenibacillus sp. CCS19]|uniref:cache domain-containing sensor histidine kinase n=1 Tax=Paenibacillus sp. CCS19 TaxID=3158387 RepID=UPI00295ED7E5|nr:sensor histidine kinase [Paenibacillus cellulosilyticus]